MSLDVRAHQVWPVFLWRLSNMAAPYRRKAFAALRQVIAAVGETSDEATGRLQHVARLFGVETGPTLVSDANTGKGSAVARAS